MREDTVFKGAFCVSKHTPGLKQLLKSISNNNLNKVTIGYLNNKFSWNKADLPTELIKDFVDTHLISESKLYGRFMANQFITAQSPCTFQSQSKRKLCCSFAIGLKG